MVKPLQERASWAFGGRIGRAGLDAWRTSCEPDYGGSGRYSRRKPLVDMQPA
jgi:hypothetical protein